MAHARREPAAAAIVGTDAKIEIENDFYAPATVGLMPRDGSPTAVESVHEGRGLHHQAIEVARRLAAGDLESPLTPLDETVPAQARQDA